MPPDSPPSIAQLQARVAELEARLAEREDSAEAHNRLLGELLDNSLANVFAADRNLRLVAINRTARETFERYRGFVPKVGDYVPQFLTKQPDITGMLAPVWPRMLAGEAFVDTLTLGPPEASRHYEIRYHPWRDGQQRIQGGYMFAYDITERLAEQERLRQAEEALRQSQKMEAVGQLTGGIAHDFNNLLGSILGALDLAGERLGQQRFADTDELIERGRHNVLRAAALVQRLLAFSRQQTLVPQPVDVQQLVAGMHDLIRSSIGPHIDLHDRTLPGQWPTRIDPQQLENALLNLCINARDAMPLGGTLSIACANVELEDTEANQLHLAAGRFLRICVEDTGIGMSNAVRQRALEPFFTTKAFGQGTGLGLSMVYGFVRQSGGQVRIDSTPGQGTAISLYLPQDESVAADLPSTAAQAPAPVAPAQQRAVKVMLVEDQPAQRLVLLEVLHELGHDVQAFEDGRQAYEALHEGRPPDLLITDVGLPGGIDGYQLADTCRSIAPQAAILLITGYDTAASTARAQADMHTELLAKPFDLQALAQAIGRLLASTAHAR
ncbi:MULTISPECIES: PAS domain-containing sensor histidine kinase [unclassified Pseudomonas]|uniref:PAS domain-containing sensor histidine kinase n=1 Tax=unclassified Pseudomonas TaxID=196821 RepID=UPI00224A4FFC|nr:MULTISPECIES: PAS domain-containing sensor histidine kinase [unclassified Pseudomonas]MCX2888260.1 response regulator [Pseudomonas sp. DCB_BI]MDH4550081.1 response regulator [Pseudomonas sp. BN607]